MLKCLFNLAYELMYMLETTVEIDPNDSSDSAVECLNCTDLIFIFVVSCMYELIYSAGVCLNYESSCISDSER